MPVFISLLIVLITTGCSNMAFERMADPTIANNAKTISSPKALLQTPLLCFSLRQTYKKGTPDVAFPEFLIITEETTGKKVLIDPLNRNFAVKVSSFWGKDPLRLVMVQIPPGEYSLTTIKYAALQDTASINTRNKYCFTVKESQVTYVGRINMLFSPVQETGWFGGKNTSMQKVFYRCETEDTMAEDEKWAKELFSGLTSIPSNHSQFSTKPVPTQGQ